MIERVQPRDHWHRKADGVNPDQALRVIRIQWKTVEALRDTPRDTWPQRTALPTALNFLAEAYADAGWYDLARLAYLEELELRRDGGRQSLLWCLTALRRVLVELELFEEALAIAEEERRVGLDLGSAGDAGYWITNLLGRLGRHEESARSAGESVAELRGQKPRRNGPPPGYDLAHALVEHSHRLATIGRYEEACDAVAEAAAFWRRHDAIRCYTAFDELSTMQLRLGRLDEARASHVEAVLAVRQHADDDAHLASALNNHGNRLSALGLDDEAEAAARESVQRHRVLAAKAEGRAMVMKYTLRLALVLIGLGVKLHHLGRLDEALAANAEAIALAQPYEDKEMGRAELARAWVNRASVLLDHGSDQDAVDAAETAIHLYRDPNPMARNTFSVAAARVGRLDEALAASLESLAEYRERHAEKPYENAPLLADALTDHAIVRSARGEHTEAAAAVAESVEMHRRLVELNPRRYRRELDRALAVSADVGGHAHGR